MPITWEIDLKFGHFNEGLASLRCCVPSSILRVVTSWMPPAPQHHHSCGEAAQEEQVGPKAGSRMLPMAPILSQQCPLEAVG